MDLEDVYYRDPPPPPPAESNSPSPTSGGVGAPLSSIIAGPLSSILGGLLPLAAHATQTTSAPMLSPTQPSGGNSNPLGQIIGGLIPSITSGVGGLLGSLRHRGLSPDPDGNEGFEEGNLGPLVAYYDEATNSTVISIFNSTFNMPDQAAGTATPDSAVALSSSQDAPQQLSDSEGDSDDDSKAVGFLGLFFR